MGLGKGSSAAAVALAVVLVGTIWWLPAGATDGVVLGPGQVVVASPSAAQLTAPVDGRMRGRSFEATVTGVSWPASVRVGNHTAVAGAGHRLVAFTLRLSEPEATLTATLGGTSATARLDVGSSAYPVPFAGLEVGISHALYGHIGSATASFCASVPDTTRSVALVMTQDGFSQRFDLWTLERLAPHPSVLYRSPTGPSVTASSKGTASLSVTNPADGLSAPASLSVRSATLSAFSPGTTGVTITKATEAFLDIALVGTVRDEVQNTTAAGAYFELTVLPGDRLTFTPAGGAPVTATMAPDKAATVGEFDDGLFAADYWFAVPATVSAGILTVVAGTQSGVECHLGCASTVVPLELGRATLSLTFPPPRAVGADQTKPPWLGAPLPPTGATAAGAVATGAANGFPVWLAVLVLVLVAGAALVTERTVRRRRTAVAGAGPVPIGTSRRSTDDGQQQVGPSSSQPEEPASVPPSQSGAVRSIPPAGAERSKVVPPLGADGDLVVRVLGPVEIAGWATAPTERRAVLEGLCAYLALHDDRPVGTDELLVALESDAFARSDGANKTLRNNLSRLRRAVGPERLPDAVTSAGYRLVGARTDWDRFCELVAQAKAAEGDRADELLAEALGHVRGIPFQGAPAGPFAWALDTALAQQMTAAVVETAHALAARRLEAGDPAGPVTAARLGQRASKVDFALWRDLFLAARAGGDKAALVRLRGEATPVLGPELARALADDRTPFSA